MSSIDTSTRSIIILAFIASTVGCATRSDTAMLAASARIAGNDLLYISRTDVVTSAYSPITPEGAGNVRHVDRSTWELRKSDGRSSAKIAEVTADNPTGTEAVIVTHGPVLVLRQFPNGGKYTERAVGAAAWTMAFQSVPVATSSSGQFTCIPSEPHEVSIFDRTTGKLSTFEVAQGHVINLKAVAEYKGAALSDDGDIIAYLVSDTTVLHWLSLAEKTNKTVSLPPGALSLGGVIHRNGETQFIFRMDTGKSPVKTIPYTTLSILNTDGGVVATMPDEIASTGKYPVKRADYMGSITILDDGNLAFSPLGQITDGYGDVAFWDVQSGKTWSKTYRMDSN